MGYAVGRGLTLLDIVCFESLCDFCAQRPEEALFVLLLDGVIPSGSDTPSFNEGLECHPGPQARQESRSQRELI